MGNRLLTRIDFAANFCRKFNLISSILFIITKVTINILFFFYYCISKKLEAKSSLYIKLNDVELDVVWKFRHFLSDKPQFLNLFLQSVCDLESTELLNKSTDLIVNWADQTDLSQTIILLVYYENHVAIRNYICRNLRDVNAYVIF